MNYSFGNNIMFDIKTIFLTIQGRKEVAGNGTRRKCKKEFLRDYTHSKLLSFLSLMR
jgi:hypothetical protein